MATAKIAKPEMHAHTLEHRMRSRGRGVYDTGDGGSADGRQPAIHSRRARRDG